MFPRPRYHAGKRSTVQHGNEIRVLAGALTHLLEEENVQNRGRGTRPRVFQRTPYPRPWRPYDGYLKRERAGPRRPPGTRYEDPRPPVLPRRGPPVAVMRVPWRYRHGQRETRQPRGSNPGGALRGGPERSADDPRRNPRGRLCGGPGRSAKEPQTPPKTKRVETKGGNQEKMKRNGMKRPMIITIEENGRE